MSSITDLTIPAEDSSTTRDLLSAYLRAQYRSLIGLPLEELVGDAGRRMKRCIAHLAASAPGPLFSVLRRPTIGGLVQFIAGRSGEPAELRAWASELIAQLSYELALLGQLGETVRVGSVPERLISLADQHAITVPSDVREIVISDDKVTLISGVETRAFTPGDRNETLCEQPFEPLDAGLVLSLVDNNPRADVEAHPDKSGNAIDLGDKSVNEWQAALGDALLLINDFLPAIFAEIELVMQQVIPVGYDTQRHMSASFKEVVGTAYLSLHPDTMTMAEAIVHEFSHNKLNMLCTLEPLLENAFSPLYPSPLRPDLRPLHGVLLAVHAFLPVERLHEQMTLAGHPLSRRPDFKQRWAEIRKINHAGADTVLTHGIAIGRGEGLLKEIAHWDDYFARVCAD